MFRFHLPLIELDVRISRIQLSDGIRRRGPRHSHWSRMSSPSLWLVPRRPGPLMEVIGNMATLQTLAASRTLPKSGPFPPPELPGFHSTMSLSDSPRGPACPSRESGEGHDPSPSGVSRVACCFLRYMPSSLPRRNPWLRCRWLPETAAFPVHKPGRLPQHNFRGLLDVHSRYGLHLRGAAKRPFPSKAPTASLPPLPLRLLPAERPLPGGTCTH